MKSTEQLFGEGVRRSKGKDARRYNLLAARLIAELIKNSLGPCGLEKMFIDVMGEVTVTKDGATLLRKIDVEHPAAKVIIEASNSVDNEVGDGTTSVVVLAGALIEKAEELLDKGIAPATIVEGYHTGLEISIEFLKNIAQSFSNSDKKIMELLVNTCLKSKSIAYNDREENKMAKLVVDAISIVADLQNNKVSVDDIKIEEKTGNSSDIQIVKGVVIDKTIDISEMPRMLENVKILLIDEELDSERTKMDLEVHISSYGQIQSYFDNESLKIKSKIQNIIKCGAKAVFSCKGINLLAQSYLSRAGIISIKRLKENDLFWLEKGTGAKITRDLDNIPAECLGHADRIYEKIVGDDKMVFVENNNNNPKSVTLLLRANSKRVLDEYHRSVLDAIFVLRDFIINPLVVAGGGSTEVFLAKKIRERANAIPGRMQIVVQKFADALEEIPLTIARNAGMDVNDTLSQIRLKYSNFPNKKTSWYGINAIERKISDMMSQGIVEPFIVKEQILETATDVASLLIRVDDVLIAKPAMYTHTHRDGTTHSHKGGQKKHDHFDKLGKLQRPFHHYY
jgi:thermosome